MKTTTNYAQWFNEAVASIAREAHARMMRESDTLRLYYKPHGLLFKVFAEGEAHDGMELVTSDPIPGSLTVQQLTGRFHDLCTRVPVLPK